MSACSIPANHSVACAGELSAEETYARLNADANAVLVDVRSQPEWQFSGVPDLPRVAFISWKIYPQMTVNPNFEEQLRATGVSKDTPLYFMCRGGGRSLDAAIAMTQAGYTQCYNVLEGFEGASNDKRQRGLISGWRAANLPWRHA